MAHTSQSIEKFSVIADEPTPPREPYSRLFLRFLHFGSLAWGGPVAQIAMIRKELVGVYVCMLQAARWRTGVASGRVARCIVV